MSANPAQRLRQRMLEDARAAEAVLRTAPVSTDPDFNVVLAELFNRFADRIGDLRAGHVDSEPAAQDNSMKAREAVERERGCTGKVRFATEYSAAGRAEAISLNGGIKMGAYECRFCGGWHLGASQSGTGLRASGRSGKAPRVVLKLNADEMLALADAVDDAVGDVLMLDGAMGSVDAIHSGVGKVARSAAAVRKEGC